MDRAPLLPQLMVIHLTAAPMPLSLGQLGTYVITVWPPIIEDLAGASYVLIHPTSPGVAGCIGGALAFTDRQTSVKLNPSALGFRAV